MAQPNLLQTALGQGTGQIETAYLIITDFRGEGGQSEPLKQGQASGAGASLAANAKRAMLETGKLAKTVTPQTRMQGPQGQERTFHVQFNPSELQLDSSSLPTAQANATQNGPQSLVNAVNKPRVEMTAQLYFDAMNPADSFLWDKYMSGVSAQSGVNLATAVAKGKGREWSVQPQVEGLIAALRNPHTRNVAFHWAEFSFVGQMTAVNARYTMFSTSGRPVRAQVTLRLRHEMDADKLGGWYKDFDEAFGANSVTSLVSKGQKLGSLLNWGI